jgi:hypothetical protein
MKNSDEPGFLDPFISASITPSLEFMASRDTPLHCCHAWESIACVVIVDHCFQLSMKNLLNRVFVAWQSRTG